MANIGISRHDMPAAYDMAAGCCPWCDLTGGIGFSDSCNVCGGTGRLLPYRVDEGVRCVTCEHFRRIGPSVWLPTIRWCAVKKSPLWSPWIWHECPHWTISIDLALAVA